MTDQQANFNTEHNLMTEDQLERSGSEEEEDRHWLEYKDHP